MNIYEPAALIADQAKRDAKNYEGNDEIAQIVVRHTEDTAQSISEQIRALPNPPSEWPVFTAAWVIQQMASTPDGEGYSQLLADAINARLAAFRPAPASEPNLERMQEASMEGKSRSIEERMMLASCGGCTCGIKTYVASYHDELCHYRIFEDAQEIIKLKDARIDVIQSRIDAAVLAEREACAQTLFQYLVDREIDPGLANQASNIIRARTTNSEIAGGHSTPVKEGTFADATAVGESPAPKRKVVQIACDSTEATSLHALCNDGSIWFFSHNSVKWTQLPAIPQPGETP